MMSFMALGVAELILLTTLGGGLGVPLGVPPAAENELMPRLAPEECLFYTSWCGTQEPDAASENHTEQLLAEDEIQQLLAKLEPMIRAMLDRAAEESGDPAAALAAELVPKWGKILLSRPAAAYVSKFALGPDGPDVEAGFVLRTDAEGQKIEDRLIKMLGDAGLEILDVAVDGGTYHQVHPAQEAPKITFGVRGTYFVVGIGEKALENMFDNVRAGTAKWLTELRKRMPVERMSTVSYANLDAILEIALGFAPDPRIGGMLEMLGLDNVKSYASVTGLDKSGFVNRSLVEIEGESKGLLAALDIEPLSADEVQHIPGDTILAMALRLNAGKVFDEVMRIAGKIEPGSEAEMQREIAQVEKVAGFKIRDELLSSLGSTWTVYSSPASGGLIGSWTATVSVRDRMTLQKVHQSLLQLAASAAAHDDDVPRIKTTTFANQDIHYLDIPDDVPLAPAWCLTNDKIIFGLFPQTIKSHLARKSKGTSLADRDDVADSLATDGGPLFLTYVDTREFFELVYPFLQMGLQAAANELEREGFDLDTALLPSVGCISKHLQPTIATVRRSEAGFEAVSRQTLPGGSVGASAPVMIALLLPAVQGARHAARRAQSMNNLKQIGLAMHNYHDVHRRLPAAYNVDKEGKPLLSWRVHILPYIEEDALYREFKLDEPWDSDHNKKLIPMMPQVYRSPSSMAEPGRTTYLTIREEKSSMIPPGDDQKGKTEPPLGASFAMIVDGTSNTVMAVEASDQRAVEWSKPDDFTPNKMDFTDGLFGMYPMGANMLFCDGSVHFLSEAVDVQLLRNLFTRDDGQAVELP